MCPYMMFLGVCVCVLDCVSIWQVNNHTKGAEGEILSVYWLKEVNIFKSQFIELGRCVDETTDNDVWFV